MADTLTRRSPLQDWDSRFAELPESVHIAEEPCTAMVDLWVDPSGAGGAAVAAVVGIDGLPTIPSTAVNGPDTTVIWFGPDEWLVTSATRAGEDLEAQLRAAVADHDGAAVDVSAQRTTLRLRGAHARDVLAKGCSLDLHPSVFGPGAAAQTMLGLAGVVLIPVDDSGTDYRILVRSSFARHLAEWLVDAAQEYTVAW
jgi:sarcosine oxidase subunit gamma